MSGLLHSLSGTLQNLGSFAYLLTFILVFFESIAVIGQFVPGAIYLAFVGFLCYIGIYHIEAMVLTAFLGHYAGEIANYYLGRHRGRAFFSEQSRYLTLDLLSRVERQFEQRGARFIIIGQFIGVLRPFISFVAGVIHYPLLRFFLVAAVADLLWALFHLGIGYVFGASWERSARLMESLSLAVFVIVLIGWFSGWLVRLLLANAGEAGEVLDRLTLRVTRSERYQHLAARFPRLFRFMENRLSLTQPWGVHATIGWLLTLLFTMLFFDTLHDVHQRPSWGLFDLSMVHLLAQMRQPLTDHVFLWMMNLGSWPTLLGMALLAALACLRARQFKSLLMIAGSFALVSSLTWLLNSIDLRSSNPALAGLLSPLLDVFPSAHSARSVALFLSLYFWLWNHPGPRPLRLVLAIAVVAGLLLIGFSRIYLGLHYPSDVLGGFFLGLSCTVVMSTVAHNAPRLPEAAGRADFYALAVLLVGLVGATLMFIHLPVAPQPRTGEPLMKVEFGSLDELLPQLPRDADSLVAEPMLPLNVVLVGDPASLLAWLRQHGWAGVPPDAFLVRQIHYPVFPAFVQGRPALWTMQRRQGSERLVLRVWPTTCRLATRDAWLGSVTLEAIETNRLNVTSFDLSPDLDLATDRLAAELKGMPYGQRLVPFRKRDLYRWEHPFFTHGQALLLEASRP